MLCLYVKYFINIYVYILYSSFLKYAAREDNSSRLILKLNLWSTIMCDCNCHRTTALIVRKGVWGGIGWQ